MAPHLTASRSAALLILFSAVMAGCANFQPVKDFSRSARTLASDYTPIVDDIVRTCQARESARRLLDPTRYDVAETRMAARKSCQPIADNVDIARSFGRAVKAYATALATMAGAKIEELGEAAGSATEAVGKLASTAATASFNADSIDAAQNLAAYAGRELMQAQIDALTRQVLVDNQQSLATTVAAMQQFVTSIYGNVQLKSHKAVLEGLLDELRTASTATRQADVTARLPYRIAQAQLQDQLDAIQSKSRRNERFSKAADALVAAHRELVEKFDRMNGKERFEKVVDFGTQVYELGDAIGKF